MAGLRRSVVAGSVVALLVAGCGSSRATTGAAAPQRGAQSASSTGAKTGSPGRPKDQQFSVLANAVCRAVRAGAPGPLHPTNSAAALRRHAAAASPVARRTYVSLQRLASQTGRQSVLRPLLADYQQLSAAYAAVGLASTDTKNVSALSRSVLVAEQKTSLAARATGLLGCAPVPEA